MKKSITVYVVEQLLYRTMEEKRRSSALISAGISGGMPIWIRSIAKLNIALSVLTAKSLSVHMGIRIGNIARMSAISSTDLEVEVMTDTQIHNEKMYLGTMTAARKLLKQGIISDEEYEQIDTMFRQKYAISLSTLFTDIRLIKYGSYGNITH